MRCDPNKIIIPSEMREVLRYKDGDTGDIITTILRMDKEADRYIDQEAVQCLVGADDYETLRNVWKFVKGNVKYRIDAPGKEVVKSPAALFKMGKGDCKSFTVSAIALMRSLGFKGLRYRFAAYGNSDAVTHVYAVCKLRGKDVIVDAVYGAFDEQSPYSWKKDYPAAKHSAVSGIHGVGQQPRLSFSQLFGLGLVAWAIFR